MDANGKVPNNQVMQLIGLLENCIRDARKGNLIGLALITSTTGSGINVAVAGSAQVSDLYMGAGMLQQQMVQLLQARPVPIPANRGSTAEQQSGVGNG